MKSIGFELKKGELRFSVLEGAFAAPQWVVHDRRVFNPDLDRASLMSWFKQNFMETLDKAAPQRVAYRVSLNANKVAQIGYLLLPWGVLNLIAFEKGLQTFEYNKMTFTAKRFGLPKGTNPEDHLDNLFGPKSPHWDSSQKVSVLAAWAALAI